MILRPLVSVLGELAYLRGWIFLMGRDGVRYGIMELMRQARRDLKRGPEELRKALLEPLYWREDDPDGHARIMRTTPEGPVVWLPEVSPWN